MRNSLPRTVAARPYRNASATERASGLPRGLQSGHEALAAMDVASTPLGTLWIVASSLAALALLAWAAYAGPWRRFAASSEAVHVWYGTIFTLIVLWSVRALLADGIAIHLLGTAGLALAAGGPFALIGGALVVIVSALIHGTPFANAATVFLLGVALPAGVVLGALRVTQRFLPPNFFVYTLAVCFAGSALAFGLSGLASAVVIAVSGAVAPDVVFGDYVPYLIYLAFGEGTLTGMLLTLAVVYRPEWVATFDDRFYLAQR
jgi:uncharacterized membrane protein